MQFLTKTIIVTDQGSWLALIIEIDQRSDKKFRQGFIGSKNSNSSVAVGRENKQQFPLLAHSLRGGRVVPHMG